MPGINLSKSKHRKSPQTTVFEMDITFGIPQQIEREHPQTVFHLGPVQQMEKW